MLSARVSRGIEAYAKRQILRRLVGIVRLPDAVATRSGNGSLR